MPALITILALVYPIVVRVGVYSGHVVIAIYYLVVLLLLPTIYGLTQRQRPGAGRGAAALLAAAALLLVPQEHETTVVMLSPVPGYTTLFLLFIFTLRPGKTPLITRIASLIRDDMPLEIVTYTRRVTIAWALFFCGMALTALLLALYAPFNVWLFFTSFLSYVLFSSMFLLEFALRYWLLGKHMNYNLVDFAVRLARLDYNSVFRS